MTNDLAILWFRQDLRLADNPALVQALSHRQVLPVYILDDVSPGQHRMGAASRLWLRRSLQSLNASLNDRLLLLSGDAETIIARLVSETSASAVYWNRCYEPWRIARDKKIKQQLSTNGISVATSNASLLWEPWTIKKKDGSPYKVFTAYFRKGCLANDTVPPPRKPVAAPDHDVLQQKLVNKHAYPGLNDLSADALLPVAEGGWEDSVISGWHVGEHAASARFEAFLQSSLQGYRQGRDFPSLQTTSRLSPHLHFGEISPHTVWHALNQRFDIYDNDDARHFSSELGWREFSYYLLYHWPTLPEQEFNSRYRGFPWQSKPSQLSAWQQGATGIPIVDAGMRELWQTGYMHNRVRMIVASFLIKNLLIDWREGEAWFWDCLFDADLAANSQSWQWVAGTGADAAPYFRIFNPVLQGEKFDPDGVYVKRFCPELSGLPKKFIHQPWKASDAVLTEAGLQLGRDYPRPIVDLKLTREQALGIYKAVADGGKIVSA